MTVFDKAVIFAVKAHQGQQRRRESTPYIIHPLEVAAICATLTADLETLAAAVLHDTVEDTDTTIEEIRTLFGERVAELVASETEDKRDDLPPEFTWRIRKEESLQHLACSDDPGVRELWLSDKLANVRSLTRSYKSVGNELWNAFNQKDPSEQAWYYRSIVELLRDYSDTEAWRELKDDVEYIFDGVD